MTTGSTFSRSERGEAGDGQPGSPCLFLVLESLRPTAPPARFALQTLKEVQLGRGPKRSVRRSRGRLEIHVADPWMSSRHAWLQLRTDRWVLEDTSKNGTLINGKAVTAPVVLEDGDLIETQSTFFLFREAVEGLEGDPDIDVKGARPLLPTLATLLPPLQRAFAELEKLARSPVPFIIFGDSGTGKEIVAQAIHALSDRKGPFVAVNCGALVVNLVESELFGARRGAFSGAIEDRKGLIRAADRGTLFLDEVADLPLPSQAALLRVLQEREVLPVGGTKPIPVDVRVISASNRNLRELADQKLFRVDLLARLAGRRIELPPLRDRTEDLGIIIAALLRRLLPDVKDEEMPAIQPTAARALLLHDWPANVRELEQALSAAVVLAGRAPIELKHLPPELQARPARMAAPDVDSEEQRALREELSRLLAEHKGNVSAIARAMGKRRQQIQRWMRRFGMPAGKGTS